MGEITGTCCGFALVLRKGTKQPQMIHPDRLIAMRVSITAPNENKTSQKGFKVC